MSGKHKVIALIVAGVCIIALFYVFFSREVIAPVQESTTPVADAPVQVDTKPASIEVRDRYQKGVHTITGVIPLPTPCYTMTSSVDVASSTPVVATIAFTSADSGGVCIQVVDERSFEVTFSAPEDVELKATLNGAPLSITRSKE